ncbi:Uncharacterized protein Fot_38321 [Forsythia ovata]|uniref:Uncharacterized protein n=1 Tax=Forsythia ovata TaxID=205694 RepID=A0ABD1S320_9LAMI
MVVESLDNQVVELLGNHPGCRVWLSMKRRLCLSDRRLCFYDRQLCRIRNLLSAGDNVDQTHSARLCQCAQTSFSDFSPSSALSLICRPILTSTLQSHCLPRSIRGQVRYIGVSNETSYGVMEFIHAAKNKGLP